VPLLAHGLEHARVFRHLDEIRPYEQAGSQHGGDAHRGHHGEPPLELLVLGFVLRALALLMPVADHAIGHEQVDGDEDKPGDPECDVDRGVHRAPVGGDRREIPRAQEVKQDRANDHTTNTIATTMAVAPVIGQNFAGGDCKLRPYIMYCELIVHSR